MEFFIEKKKRSNFKISKPNENFFFNLTVILINLKIFKFYNLIKIFLMTNIHENNF